MNVGSKEKELRRLLEVLRIKAEIHVLVFHLLQCDALCLSFLKVWDHVSCLLTTDQNAGLENEVKFHLTNQASLF